MNITLKRIKKSILNIFAIFFIVVMLTPVVIVLTTVQNTNGYKILNEAQLILPFSLNKIDIVYNSIIEEENTNTTEIFRKEVLKRAEAMTEVKWVPKYNLIDEKGSYIFIKGNTYCGIPYSMDSYQVTSENDFLSKIKDSKIIYGNDCSGFVSAAWGISRQTTLSLCNALKNKSKINGKTVQQISWNDIKPGDALLLNSDNGKGHIMLYINCDEKNDDNLNVYEQNIPTVIPFEPIPVARKDVRSKSKLISDGYVPIRLTP